MIICERMRERGERDRERDRERERIIKESGVAGNKEDNAVIAEDNRGCIYACTYGL